MNIVLQVKLYDDEGKVVEEQVHVYASSHTYGYEVERMFTGIGEALAKKLDPSHD